MCNAIGALRNVQREYLTCVDNEWDHARGNEQRDENRRDRVEAGPAIKLDEERRYDHADGAKRVLLMVSKPKNKNKVKEEGKTTHCHDVQEEAAHIMTMSFVRVPTPVDV